MKYRADIDGLRAIAVLAVIAFHYAASLPPWAQLQSGFTGVDIFFVISGYLITRQIYPEIKEHRFSIVEFYDRRARRILPALFVMLLATLLAGYFILMPGDFKSLSASAATASFGLSNFYFLFNTGYFDRAAELMPLLHTWSLAVEEHFYVFWPLILTTLCARSRPTGQLVVICLLGGLALAALWTWLDPKTAFYLVLPRAWELLAGAALVFAPSLQRLKAETAGVAGLALIAIAVSLPNSGKLSIDPQILACGGAALLIWPKASPTISGKAVALLSPIGRVSYSFYLYHWPVWVLYRFYINGNVPSLAEAGSLVVLSFLLACASYVFIEQPIRRIRLPRGAPITLGFAASFASLFAAIGVFVGNGLPDRVSPDAIALSGLKTMWTWDCPAMVDIDGKSYCSFGARWDTAQRRAILWGDSHAQHLAPVLEPVARKLDISFIIEGMCPAALGAVVARQFPGERNYEKRCQDAHRDSLTAIEKGRIDTVVLASAWTSLADTNLYPVQPGGVINPGNKIELIRAGLIDAIKHIDPSTHQIVVVTDIPGPGKLMTECFLARLVNLVRRHCSDDDLRILAEDKRATFGQVTDVVASLDQLGVTVVKPIETMCAARECVSQIDGQFLFMDVSHLRRNMPASVYEKLAGILGLAQSLSREPPERVRPDR